MFLLQKLSFTTKICRILFGIKGSFMGCLLVMINKPRAHCVKTYCLLVPINKQTTNCTKNLTLKTFITTCRTSHLECIHFYGTRPIHPMMNVSYSRCHSHNGSSWSKKFMPKSFNNAHEQFWHKLNFFFVLTNFEILFITCVKKVKKS